MDTKIISNNFNRNKDRYIVGKHFYCLEGDDLRAFRANHQIDELPSNLNKLYLWTEQGALLHAKSLNTNKAWETYDYLVETYFRVRDMKMKLDELSPQLQLLIQLETHQKQQARQIEATNKRLDDIGDLVSLNPVSWRDETQQLIKRISDSLGGIEHIRDVHSEIYGLVEVRVGCNLKQRLTNKKRRMAEEGVSKSRRDKLNRLDVIADDKKLVEIYIAIVKEMSVKYLGQNG